MIGTTNIKGGSNLMSKVLRISIGLNYNYDFSNFVIAYLDFNQFTCQGFRYMSVIYHKFTRCMNLGYQESIFPMVRLVLQRSTGL